MINTLPHPIQPRSPLQMFWNLTHQGRMHRLWARLTGRAFSLMDLNEILQEGEVRGGYDAGLKTVKIAHIRGTLGKATDFDAEFNPIQERTQSRWLDIARKLLAGCDLPPVELVQVNDIYYVRDGHHRISVSRSLGQQFIDAHVTVLKISGAGT